MTVLLQNRPKKMKSREAIHFMTVLLQNRPKNEVKGSNPLDDFVAGIDVYHLIDVIHSKD